MKKVIVIGCPGSGKTTFSEKLSKKTGIPLYYLDAIWHRADRTHIPVEEFEDRLSEIYLQDEWIIDGNYASSFEARIKECDTVFFFDLPTEVCLEGAIERLGKKRADMPWFDNELDPYFKKTIETFGEYILPYMYEVIEKHQEGKNIVVFKSRDEANKYLNK